MFPLAQVPVAVAQFLAVYWGLIAFSLLLRLYDELKDVETDLSLGDVGDPLYVGRPIVTGHVRKEDLVWLRWAVTGLLITINLPLGPTPAFGAFVVAFVLCWLSFRWFFWPRIRTNVLLAFATHSPLAGVLGAYIVVLFADDFGWQAVDASALLIIVGTWFSISAWELSRKVRIPEEETDYQTYSKMLGWKAAALAPAVFLGAAAVCLLLVLREIGLGWPYQAALLAVAGLGVGACLRFRFAPTSEGSNLRPFMELFVVVVFIGLAVTLSVTRGVEWVSIAPWYAA
jgi:4-hydroxybenzoate polyprenyltransferase